MFTTQQIKRERRWRSDLDVNTDVEGIHELSCRGLHTFYSRICMLRFDRMSVQVIAVETWLLIARCKSTE